MACYKNLIVIYYDFVKQRIEIKSGFDKYQNGLEHSHTYTYYIYTFFYQGSAAIIICFVYFNSQPD